MQEKRLQWIDSCRGIAILFVIIVHVGQLFSNTSINHISSFAKNGVQMFFIISGYTLFFSLEKNRNKSYKSFIIRRFFRIAPLYYMSALYYSLMAINKLNVKFLLINLLFLNQFYLPAFNYIPPGGWSIATEMVFYTFIPFLYKNINSLKGSLAYFLAALLISIGANILIYYILTHYYRRPYYISDSLLINNFPTLFMGIILYFLVKQTKIRLNSIYIFTLALILFIYLIKFPYSIEYNNIYKLPNSIINYTFCFSIVVFLIILGIYNLSQDSFLMSIFQKIGKLSFSIYLIHFTIVYQLGQILKTDTNNGFIFILSIILVTAVSYQISKLTFKIELAGQKFGEKIIAKFNY